MISRAGLWGWVFRLLLCFGNWAGLGWAGLSGLEPGWAGLCCGLAGFSAFAFSEWVFRLLLCFGNPGWAWAGGLKGSEDLSPGRAAGSDR